MDIFIKKISYILQNFLEGYIKDNCKKIQEMNFKSKFEKDIFDKIECKIKEEFEKEKISDLLMKEIYDLNNEFLLYSTTSKEQFVKDFFEANKELKYLHTNELENIIYYFLDKSNEIVNKLLSTEGKLIIKTIKKDNIEHTEELKLLIKQSTNEIKKSISKEKIHSETTRVNNEHKCIRQCIGYGTKSGVCTNSVEVDGVEYCVECLKSEYADRVINLYKIQRYSILKEKNYYIASQNIGIVQIKLIIFPLYSNSLEISNNEIYTLIENISEISNLHEYNFIHIVSNGEFETIHKNMLNKHLKPHKVAIYTEDNIINQIMDFNYYLNKIVNDYEKNELFSHYIEIYDVNTNEILQNSINDFIKENSTNALLILGDYGCGKTSFLLNLSYTLAKSYLEGKNQYIPIFIPLKEYSKAVKFKNLFMSFFSDECNISNPSMEAFQLLLKYRKFIILFDGFDEVAKRVDYDVKFETFNEICKYGINDTKILVTCRPNYFQEKREYKRLIEKAHLHFEPTNNSLDFKETYIKELNEGQIIKYVESFSEDFKKSNISSDDIKYFIKQTHDLMDLSKRPFLLNIIVKTLPQLINELKNGTKLDKIEINAAKLYEKYVNLWLDREDLKGKTLIRQEDKLHFCKHVAYKMFEDDRYYLNFKEFPEEIRKYFTGLSNIDEINYFSHDIQSCSFMSADGLGNFKFIHKSFMEYFVATMICDELKNTKKLDASYLNKVLSIQGISTEIALFINDLLSNNHIIKNKVFAALESNIDLVDSKVRDNIITILTKTKSNIGNLIENNKDYVGNDFSHSVIKNKVIENVDFSNATFYNAIIENVKFINCQFKETHFQKVTLIHTDFSNQILNCSDLSYSEINNCKFNDSSLIDCQMMHASICNNDFENSDLSGISVEGSIFNENYFENALGLPYEMS